MFAVFQDYARTSNLTLNLGKTIVIPLSCKVTLAEWRDRVLYRHPCWWGTSFRLSGTYLGFVIGPGAEDKVWYKPVERLLAQLVGKLASCRSRLLGDDMVPGF